MKIQSQWTVWKAVRTQERMMETMTGETLLTCAVRWCLETGGKEKRKRK